MNHLECLKPIVQRFGLGEVEDLLKMLNIASSVISGSVALSLLHPDAFQPNDIDFLVPKHNQIIVSAYLQTVGYRRLNEETAQYICGSISIIFVFKHEVTGEIANLIVSETSSPLQPIIEFHSTIIMNFISWYGIVSLYPELTMRKIGYENVQENLPRRYLQKYLDRGFTIKKHYEECISNDQENHICGVDPNCPHAMRSLHDKHASFLPFANNHNDLLFEPPLCWRLSAKCMRQDPRFSFGFSINDSREIRFFENLPDY
jgi:hypothetical protein